jgi:hypothetical protein
MFEMGIFVFKFKHRLHVFFLECRKRSFGDFQINIVPLDHLRSIYQILEIIGIQICVCQSTLRSIFHKGFCQIQHKTTTRKAK